MQEKDSEFSENANSSSEWTEGTEASIANLDFTDETAIEQESAIETKPYDPRPFEDTARRNIAYSLIFLLFLTVIGIFILLCHKVVGIADLKEFSVILSPLLTLVSAATGFYYGTKNQK